MQLVGSSKKIYYPYFLGKSFELIAIRESAELLHKSKFVPVIEPVRQNFRALFKTLDEVARFRGEAIVIANPEFGNFKSGQNSIAEEIEKNYSGFTNISLGFLLKENMQQNDIDFILQSRGDKVSCLIHAGFSEAKSLRNFLGNDFGNFHHIFLENQCGRLYRRRFESSNRVLLRDGFRRQINRDYPDQEFFSDLHATYQEEGMTGFGDFLTVGNHFSETVGPAYAVAIHLTFIDSDKDGEMHIHHFQSIHQDNPKDPAGKFAEALSKLVDEVRDQNNQIFVSNAIKEFIYLHQKGHFPGLGYVKKLSIKHHIETLADYFQNRI